MQGYDVLAKAKTGTGKTLAFLIPIAEHLVASATPVRGQLGGPGGGVAYAQALCGGSGSGREGGGHTVVFWGVGRKGLACSRSQPTAAAYTRRVSHGVIVLVSMREGASDLCVCCCVCAARWWSHPCAGAGTYT